MNLDKLFYPTTLAIVGASGKKGKLGYNVFKNLLEHGYEGQIYPVNLKADEILGIKAYSEVKDIENSVDAAVSIVPAKITPQVIEDCFEHGIKFVTIEAAGFGEAGEKGRRISREIRTLIEEYPGHHVLGPNCSGIINVNNGMCQSIGRIGELKPGGVGLIAQAGVYAAGILWGLRRILNFSIIATVGNKLDIDETDLLEFMGHEDSIEVIALYLEDIKRGNKFLEVAKKVAEDKPIVVLKGGRTNEGKVTAATHTAAIGGSREAYETLFHEAGIIQAKDNEHIFDLTRGFVKQPLPPSDKAMVITYSGSQGITATDTLNEYGLNLAELGEESKTRLTKIIPEIIEGTNPADLTFNQDPRQVKDIIEIVSTEDNVGCFIVSLQPEKLPDYLDYLDKVESSDKPVLIAVTGREFVMENVIKIEDLGYPVFQTPERAVEVFAKMYKYRNLEVSTASSDTFQGNKDKVIKILKEIKRNEYKTFGGIKALQVLEAYNIPVVDCYLAKNPDESKDISAKIKGPTAMKIESPRVLHKSDVEGIELNVTKENSSSAFKDIIRRVVSNVGSVERDQIDGVCIQPMIRKGHETIMGVTYDSNLKVHLINFGMGGKYVEIFNDVSRRIVPIDRSMAHRMIDETDYMGRLLEGPREERGCNTALIAEALIRLSQLIKDFPEVEEVEINPFTIWEREGVAVDARLKLR